MWRILVVRVNYYTTREMLVWVGPHCDLIAFLEFLDVDVCSVRDAERVFDVAEYSDVSEAPN